MEFLKELFGGGSLTYEQLAAAVKGKGMQVVNASDGAYVPKSDIDGLSGQITTLQTQLGEANRKLEGYDPSWKEKAETARKQLEAQQLDFALEKAVAWAKPVNAKVILRMLDREKLHFADGEVVGLDKQLNALKRGEDTAFLFAPEEKSGMSHQNAREVGGADTKEAANAALRSCFGRTD